MKKSKLAIPAAILAGLFTTLMVTMIKLGEERGETIGAILFWRAAWALFFLIPIITFSPPKIAFLEKVRTKRWGLYIIRGLLGFVALTLLIYALRTLTLTMSTTLAFTVPFFMPFVAYFWKRVPFPRWSWVGVIVGFIGVLFVIKPGARLFQPIALVALFSGMIRACGQFASHLLGRTETTRTINFYFFVISGTMGALLTLFDPVASWTHLDAIDYLIFFSLGVFGLLYVFLLTFALKNGVPSLITVFLYVSILFAIGIDYWVWKVTIDTLTLIGVILVILGVVIKYFLHRREVKQD